MAGRIWGIFLAQLLYGKSRLLSLRVITYTSTISQYIWWHLGIIIWLVIIYRSASYSGSIVTLTIQSWDKASCWPEQLYNECLIVYIIHYSWKFNRETPTAAWLSFVSFHHCAMRLYCVTLTCVLVWRHHFVPIAPSIDFILFSITASRKWMQGVVVATEWYYLPTSKILGCYKSLQRS